MGRKPISDVPKSGTPLRILLTESERAELDFAASAFSLSTSTWARDLLLKAARAAGSRDATLPVTPAKKSTKKTAKTDK